METKAGTWANRMALFGTGTSCGNEPGWPYCGYAHKPASEHEGAEGSVLNYHGHQIRALSRWYMLSGDKTALAMAGKLARFTMKPKLWGAKDSDWIEPEQNAHFDGHHHGVCTVLRGLLEYAEAANNPQVKEFVRSGFEYDVSRGIGRLGCFGDHAHRANTEGCTIADMVALAIKLSDYGVVDYWDDADQLVRSQCPNLSSSIAT